MSVSLSLLSRCRHGMGMIGASKVAYTGTATATATAVFASTSTCTVESRCVAVASACRRSICSMTGAGGSSHSCSTHKSSPSPSPSPRVSFGSSTPTPTPTATPIPTPSPSASTTSSRRLAAAPSGLMNAWVLTKTSPSDFEMVPEQLHIPVPGPTEFLIKTRACGVCHTDLHLMKSEVAFPLPCVMGHEISGEIVEIGNQVNTSLKVGDHVMSPFIMPCGTCHYCVRDNEDLCETFFSHNRLRGVLYDGHTRLFRSDAARTPVHMYSMAGLAEYCVVPQTAVFKLPKQLSYCDSSILGCAMFTAYGAIRHGANMRAGESVAVIGTGGVGANCLQFARAFGGNKIIAVDVSDDKLATMLKLGATHTINAKTENVLERIREITAGRGVDICVEALGHPLTFSQCVQAVMDGGRAVMVGIAPAGTQASVEITRIVRRQIRIIGSYGAKARQDVPTILQMAANGQIDVSAPISRRYAFQDAATAYHDLNRGAITGRGIVDFEL